MKSHHGLSLSALIMLLAACGGGDGASAEEPRVRLLANTSYTPWQSGSVGFLIAPALSSNETVRCRIDDAADVPCVKGGGAGSGRVSYTSFKEGRHTLHVTISGGGTSTTHTLQWRIGQPDVVVVGGTPGGISAAIAASRKGRTVIVLEQSKWLGGLMSGGLARSDVGASGGSNLGGITREFFRRVRALENARGACGERPCASEWAFEPRAALNTFEDMLADEPNVFIQREMVFSSVKKTGAAIESLQTPRGTLKAKIFIDASYEGDLTAAAGATMVMGRERRLTPAESAAQPGLYEPDAGIAGAGISGGVVIDPYVVPGDPASGLIPFVQRKVTSKLRGAADPLVMAYNYRVCVTDDPDNRVPFQKPAGYRAEWYEGSARMVEAMLASRPSKDPVATYFVPTPTVRSSNRNYFKHDLNGGPPFSTDMSAPGWNQAYPAGSWDDRREIAEAYKTYIQGLLYAWQTNPRFGPLNARVSQFGLCKDEFVDNGNWPYRMYTRETRRMVGEYVMNENDVLQNAQRPRIADSVGTAGYSMDNHLRQLAVGRMRVNGAEPRDVVVTEGFLNIKLPEGRPYPVSYRSLLPQRSEVSNLLNPVTMSATSLAYSSLRMEPTFMVLGQAAGTAAALAIDGRVDVHRVDISSLQDALRADGQVLSCADVECR